MYMASADYPNSDISTGAMVVIAVVMASVLLIWLGSVYLAERQRPGAGTASAQLPPRADTAGWRGG